MPGRGRGRGRAPPTGGRLFLMRSAEECGYDARNLRSLQDITRPELFPSMFLHSSGNNKKLTSTDDSGIDQPDIQPPQPQQSQSQGVKVESGSVDNTTPVDPTTPSNNVMKRSAQTLYLITKGREIHHRIQDSAFYVKTTKDVPDIIKYSDATKPHPITDASTVLSHCLRGRKRTAMGYFIPEELVSGQKIVSSDLGRATGAGDIDPREVRPRLGSVDNAAAEGGGAMAVDEGEEIDEGSEEEGEDYVADYYASEEENDLDGDNEATF